MEPKLSLPAVDVASLDACAAQTEVGRSVIGHRALEPLREARLRGEDEVALLEWSASDEADLWASTDVDRTAREAW